MQPAGYLINNKEKLEGQRGFIYDYMLAENGLFLQSRSPLLWARICIAAVLVKGLKPLEKGIYLPEGKIPKRLYDLALSVLYVDPRKECYLAITWEDEYRLRMPTQDRHGQSVTYEVVENTVLDIHSHGTLRAFDSDQDNLDDQGFKLSMVAGKMDIAEPEFNIRVCVYGYYAPVELEDVFDVSPQ